MEVALAKLFILLASKHVEFVLGAPIKAIEILPMLRLPFKNSVKCLLLDRSSKAPAEGGRACPRGKQVSVEKKMTRFIPQITVCGFLDLEDVKEEKKWL